MSGLPAVGAFREKLESSGLATDAVDAAVLQFQQTMYDLLPETHGLKSGMKADLVHGEDENMRAVFAATARSSAHMLARLKYSQNLSLAMIKLKTAKSGKGKDTEAYLRNEILKRASTSMTYTPSPFAESLLKWSFFTHLGASPAFIFMNAHQVPVVSLPWIAGKLSGSVTSGYKRTTVSLAQASKDVYKMLRWDHTGTAKQIASGEAEARSVMDLDAAEEAADKIADPVQRAARLAEVGYLKHAEEVGLLNSTMELNMAEEAAVTSKKLRNMARTIALPVHAGESRNARGERVPVGAACVHVLEERLRRETLRTLGLFLLDGRAVLEDR
jgi:hypothetical protein